MLLFLLLQRMTGRVWRSALVAALFAWHPLHVESVAWVSERKDVLSTFFWLLTMMAYVKYVQSSKVQRRAPSRKIRRFITLLALICFVLGLMSKPMVVTLPFVLLLMDYWPLGRIYDLRFAIYEPEMKAESRSIGKLAVGKGAVLRAGGGGMRGDGLGAEGREFGGERGRVAGAGPHRERAG